MKKENDRKASPAKPRKPWYRRLWRSIAHRARQTGDRMCPHCRCEDCPLSWEDRGPEDCDAGCLVYGDLYEGSPCCYLPLFVKNLIRRRIEAKRDRYEEEQWDGMAELYEKEEKLNEAMRDALKEEFPGMEFPLDAHARLRMAYEDNCRGRNLRLEAREISVENDTGKGKAHGKKRRKGKD